MGAEAWDYFVPYEEDIQSALDKLKQREFEAGRYYPSDEKPATIAQAIELADASGTKSILDMNTVADTPDYSVVTPLSTEDQVRIFGAAKPTRILIEDKMEEIYDDIDRGQGVYIIAYEGERPSEIFFAGYSYD